MEDYSGPVQSNGRRRFIDKYGNRTVTVLLFSLRSLCCGWWMSLSIRADDSHCFTDKQCGLSAISVHVGTAIYICLLHDSVTCIIFGYPGLFWNTTLIWPGNMILWNNGRNKSYFGIYIKYQYRLQCQHNDTAYV